MFGAASFGIAVDIAVVDIVLAVVILRMRQTVVAQSTTTKVRTLVYRR